MSAFRLQLEAIGSALLLIQRLAEGTVWALIVTNDDDQRKAPTVLNIYADPLDWAAICDRLKLKNPCDHQLDEFISFQQGTLLISITKE
jgi:hypothetical protein